MINTLKKSFPVWVGVTLYLCYGEMFLEPENILKFVEQFLIVALVGGLILIFQEYVIDWIYDWKGKYLRSFFMRCVVNSIVNVMALYIVLVGIVLLDKNNGFEHYIPVFINNGLMVVVITIGHVVYYTRKFNQALTKKQQNT